MYLQIVCAKRQLFYLSLKVNFRRPAFKWQVYVWPQAMFCAIHQWPLGCAMERGETPFYHLYTWPQASHAIVSSLQGVEWVHTKWWDT